jgi:hypothetical protein
MGVPSFILNEGWLQIGISAFTMHDQAVPPVPPLPTPLPNVPGLIEGPAFMGWPPGMLSHKTAHTVLSDGNPTVQQGHDIGYLIPHFAIPMNALCAVHTAVSKHKVVFPVSTVKVGGNPAGTYMFVFLGEICANPVSLPTGVVLVLKCTVITSLSLADIVKGVLIIAIDIGFDLLWNKLKQIKVFEKFLKPFNSKKFLEVLGGLTLGEMISFGGGRLVGRFILNELGNKVIQNIVKSWILSPLVTGLPFGKSSIGRGNWASHKFF